MTSTPSFDSVEHATTRLAEVGYLADHRLATTVYLQTRLDKPVLLEGPAGVGKTELAKALAASTGRRLVRLQCYEGQDETRALYEWDYGKQMLYTQMLREKIGEVVEESRDISEAVQRIGAHEDVFFSERFLSPRPLLEAVRSPEPVVLLVDEVDRADEALEAVLLEVLAEAQVSVPEIGTFTAENPPHVVLTSNNTRDLSSALKRRCLHLFLDYPDAQRELDIVRSKGTGLDAALAEHLVHVVRELRQLDLRKPPSLSETVDWARTLAVLGVGEIDPEQLEPTLSVVLKYDKDLAKAREVLPELVRAAGSPTGELPGTGDNPTAATQSGPRGGSRDNGDPRSDDNTASSANGQVAKKRDEQRESPHRVSTGQGERSFTSKFTRRNT